MGVAVLLLALAAPGAKVAVLDLMTPGLAEEQGKALSQSLVPLIASEVSALGHSVISTTDIQAMLSFERQKALLGCNDDTSCLAEIGGALGVDLLVSGTLAKLGDTYNLTLTVLDIRTAEVKQRFQGQAGGDAALAATVKRGVAALFEQKLDVTATGTLFVKTDPDGATIYLDDKELGLSPLTLDEVASGDHVISAKKGDKQGRVAIRLHPGTLERVTMTLVSRRVKLKVLSTPAEALVELDGVAVGNTPLLLDEVTAGAHRVRISLDGHFASEETLTLDHDAFAQSGGVPFKVDARLRAKPELLSVPLTAALSLATNTWSFGRAHEGFTGVSPGVELGVAPGLFDLTVGVGAPLHVPVTVRFWLWREGLQLGVHARAVVIDEQPSGSAWAFAGSFGASLGYGVETDVGLVSARVEPAISRSHGAISVPLTMALAWRL